MQGQKKKVWGWEEVVRRSGYSRADRFLDGCALIWSASWKCWHEELTRASGVVWLSPGGTSSENFTSPPVGLFQGVYDTHRPWSDQFYCQPKWLVNLGKTIHHSRIFFLFTYFNCVQQPLGYSLTICRNEFNHLRSKFNELCRWLLPTIVRYHSDEKLREKDFKAEINYILNLWHSKKVAPCAASF